MNYSNSTNVPKSSLKLFKITVIILLLFFGIVCNGLALWVFCCKMKKWKVTVIYMVNLIISDILILMTFPFQLYDYFSTSKLENNLCKASISFYVMNTYMSIFTITIISADRYLAIRFPVRSKRWRSPGKAVGICCIVWLFQISLSIMLTLRLDYIIPVCFQKVSNTPNPMFLLFAVVGFTVPLIIISFCTVQVIRTLYSKEKRDVNEQRSVRKSINIILSNMVVFVICFLPIHMGYTIRFVAETVKVTDQTLEQIKRFIDVAISMAHSNCVLDSLCYYFVAGEFWKASDLSPRIIYSNIKKKSLVTD
ncbi:G-protein coupled receptor 35 [Xenopus laevis]|uniref:G-protein coupled receptor 35 n=2 Tax=Xenopus laevis TaxID=8355 RepID=A0A1L8G4U1_XENLA|nr:G-protein coupled receptor 35 [Xenopus laevis]OCT78836.1 hypothetical protein XELAEV_18029926mg [Xenopus laevis]